VQISAAALTCSSGHCAAEQRDEVAQTHGNNVARAAEKLHSHSPNDPLTGKANLADCRPHMEQKQQTRVETMPSSTHHQVLIVGGGTAGITVAAILKRRAPVANIAIVEPARDHYYGPTIRPPFGTRAKDSMDRSITAAAGSAACGASISNSRQSVECSDSCETKLFGSYFVLSGTGGRPGSVGWQISTPPPENGLPHGAAKATKAAAPEATEAATAAPRRIAGRHTHGCVLTREAAMVALRRAGGGVFLWVACLPPTTKERVSQIDWPRFRDARPGPSR
jgi:hypothetical protein